MRIKEQVKRLTLNQHDDDDGDDENKPEVFRGVLRKVVGPEKDELN